MGGVRRTPEGRSRGEEEEFKRIRDAGSRYKRTRTEAEADRLIGQMLRSRLGAHEEAVKGGARPRRHLSHSVVAAG
jgi:hypothetical protein